MAARPLPVVDVAVGIVRATDGRVLMAERTARQVAAGFWELPGGKIDAGETPAEAAARELDEEIGIRALSMRPRIAYDHTFPTKRVRLHFFEIDTWSGTPRGREGQRLAWVDPAEPSVAPVLPSNERLIVALGLSPVCLAFQPLRSGATESMRRLAEALSGGVRCIAVREPHLTPDQRVAFARRVDALARPFGAHVLLEGTPLEAQRAGVAGLLSSPGELHRITRRPHVRLWAAACNTAGDLARAARLGADVAVVSPVFSSARDAGGTSLGWEGLRSLAESAPIAVYAEGGMTQARLSQAQRAGAAGIIVPEF